MKARQWLMARVRRYAASRLPEQRKDPLNKRFTLLPATFFNKERFDDEALGLEATNGNSRALVGAAAPADNQQVVDWDE